VTFTLFPPPLFCIQTAFVAGVLNLLEFAHERNALFLQASTSEVHHLNHKQFLHSIFNHHFRHAQSGCCH
jgi:hypothetical protein